MHRSCITQWTYISFIKKLLKKYAYFSIMHIEVPSRVDGKRRNLARVSDFVSWDEACRVPIHSRVQDSSSFHPRVIEPVSPTIKRRNLHVLP